MIITTMFPLGCFLLAIFCICSVIFFIKIFMRELKTDPPQSLIDILIYLLPILFCALGGTVSIIALIQTFPTI